MFIYLAVFPPDLYFLHWGISIFLRLPITVICDKNVNVDELAGTHPPKLNITSNTLPNAHTNIRTCPNTLTGR